MGVYYLTVFCYGFYIPKRPNNINYDEINYNKDMYILDKDGLLVLVPRTFKSSAPDAIIDNNDMNQEHIKMGDIVSVLKYSETLFDISVEESTDIQDLALKYSIPLKEIGKWAIEYMATSLEKGDNSYSFIKKLPIL
jgi:hypothetical protein